MCDIFYFQICYIGAQSIHAFQTIVTVLVRTMGVLGLSRYIESSNSDPRIFEPIPARSVLLIDGVAFMIQILDICSIQIPVVRPLQFSRSRQLLESFSYENFHQKLRGEVNTLRENYGLEIIVYFDSSCSSSNKAISTHEFMKLHTAVSRATRRAHSWQALYRLFAAPTEFKGRPELVTKLWSSSQLPWPALLQAQMKASLTGLGVPFYSRETSLLATLNLAVQRSELAIQRKFAELIQLTIDMENENGIDTTHVDADCMMAFHCDYLNRECSSCPCGTNHDSDAFEEVSVPTPAFVYGRDSDFIVMKDCPYIELGSFRHMEVALAGQGQEKEVQVKIQARVFRRAAVAAALSLTEHQLVEFCLLLGNDFVSQYPRLNMLHSPSLLCGAQQNLPPKLFSNVHSVHSIDMIRRWVRTAKSSSGCSEGSGIVNKTQTHKKINRNRSSGKKHLKGASGQRLSLSTGSHHNGIGEEETKEFECFSRVPAVLTSLQYSRAFYNHDLVTLCQFVAGDTYISTDTKTFSGARTGPSAATPYYLTENEAKIIESLLPELEQLCVTAADSDLGSVMGKCAVLCLESMAKREQNVLSAQSELSSGKDFVAGIDSDSQAMMAAFRWNCVTKRHLDVLRSMLIQLQFRANNRDEQNEESSVELKQEEAQSTSQEQEQEKTCNSSTWSDVVVGLLYEQILRVLGTIQRDLIAMPCSRAASSISSQLRFIAYDCQPRNNMDWKIYLKYCVLKATE